MKSVPPHALDNVLGNAFNYRTSNYSVLWLLQGPLQPA